MVVSENKAQHFLDKYGAIVGVTGVALAMVFGVLWLSGADFETAAPSSATAPQTTLPLTAPLPDVSVSITAPFEVSEEPAVTEFADTDPTWSLIAVKIDNAPGARPQVGLGLSLILVEMPVEGGLTRFTAFFAAGEDAPTVGPIRSLRWTDVLFVPLFSDSIVTTGGRDFIVGAMLSEGVQVFALESTAVLRNGRSAPYDIEAAISLVPMGVPKGPFSAGFPIDNPARPDSITIPYSSIEHVEWRWEEGGFVRYSNGERHMVTQLSGGDEAPLSRSAVLVLSVVQRSAGYTDSAGADVPIFDLLGTGFALLTTEDGMIEGVWMRLSKDDPFTILDSEGQAVMVPLDGLVIALVPTFVEVSSE